MQVGIKETSRPLVSEAFVDQFRFHSKWERSHQIDSEQKSDMIRLLFFLKIILFCTKGVYYLLKIKYIFRTRSFHHNVENRLKKRAPLKGNCRHLAGGGSGRGNGSAGREAGLGV